MRDDVIVVFGGAGFLGRHVVRALAKADKRVRVVMRRPHLGIDLRVLGGVGQVQLIQGNVRYPDSIAAALAGADGVVNCVGTIAPGGAQNFQALHVDAAQAIAAAAAKRGIDRLVQISALGASPKGARYYRSKLEGEQAARAALPATVLLRPSIIFGSEDTFFNRFAAMTRSAPALPLIGGKTKLQPVFAGDVANAVVAALDDTRARGRTFELGGPHTYTFKQLLNYIRTETYRKPTLVPLPFLVAHPFGLLVEWLFKAIPFAEAPLTEDQVTMLKRDNVVGANAEGFAALGIHQLESVEAVVPSYLWRFRPYGQFQTNEVA